MDTKGKSGGGVNWEIGIDTNIDGLPRWPVVKSLPANVGDAKDTSLIPGLGRSLRVENGNPLQYSCLENSMDRGAHRSHSMGSQRVGHN